MPRFIARVRINAQYSAVVATPADGDLVGLTASTERPDIDPIDWILETDQPMHAEILGHNTAFTRVTLPVTGRRPMAVYAANEVQARLVAVASAAKWRDDVFSSHAPKGWHADAEEAVVESIRRDEGSKRPKSRFEVDFSRLLAPDCSLHPLHLDQAFETFRWMVASSTPYSVDCSYHTQTVHLLLNGAAERRSLDGVSPIRSIDDLKSRFQYALLGQSYDIYQIWRDDHGLHPSAKITINVLHHGANGHHVATKRPKTLEDAFSSLCANARGLRMRRSPNSCHDDATLIQSFGVVVSAHGFEFVIDYGMTTDFIASSWRLGLAKTRGGEPFYETLDRALLRFMDLVPDYEDQLQSNRDKRRKSELTAAA